MQFAEQRATVEGLNIKANSTKRSDCPFCGGKNSFTASKERGILRWHCFREACQAKGRTNHAVSQDDLKRIIADNTFDDKEAWYCTEALDGLTVDAWDPPSYFQTVGNNNFSRQYVVQHHLVHAIEDSRVQMRFDPRTNRVVFFIKRGRFTYDAIGRGLGETVPKWLRYGHSTVPFLCLSKDQRDNKGVDGVRPRICVVEDAASAVSVSVACTGMALLGTNLTPHAKAELATYGKVLLALDPEATGTAIRMAHELSPYVDVEVLMLKEEFKWLPPEKILNMKWFK